MNRLIAILFVFLTLTSQAATRYLDAAATGANNGTSPADAWVLNGTAFSGLVDGDTLIVSPGTYTVGISMTNKANITVQIKAGSTTPAIFSRMHLYNCDNLVINGYEGGQPLIKLTGFDPTYGGTVNLRKSSNVDINGVLIDRGTSYLSDTALQHGFHVWDQSSDFMIRNCTILNVSGDGINVSQVSPGPTPGREMDWTRILDNTIVGVSDDGIYLANGYATVTGNYVDNNEMPISFGGHPDGIQTHSAGGRYLTVANNTFKGFNQNMFLNGVDGENYVYNNICIGTRPASDRGLDISTSSSATGNIVVANNVFYNFYAYWGINWPYFGPGRDTTANYVIKNNIFLNCKYLVGQNEALLDATNLSYYLPGYQAYTTDGITQSQPADNRDGAAVNADPLLTDPAGGVFTISSALSPAIGAGENMSEYFTTDIAGTVRSLPFDIGAYEYAAGTNAAPVVTVTSPADGTTSEVAAVTFTGTATDAEDGTLSSGITWTSSLDGALGTGASVTPTLSSGTHTITASRTDAGSLTTSASIGITINPPSATFNVETLSVSRIRVVP